MARRKRQLLEDDSDSSDGSEGDDINDYGPGQNDPDAREERALFQDPYKRKRRRKNGKDDAIYGVFGSENEDEGFGGKDVVQVVSQDNLAFMITGLKIRPQTLQEYSRTDRSASTVFR